MYIPSIWTHPEWEKLHTGKQGHTRGFPAHKHQDQPKESPFRRLTTASELVNPHKNIPVPSSPWLSCFLVQPRHHPGIVHPESVGPGQKIQGKGNPSSLSMKNKKVKTRKKTQIIPLDEDEKASGVKSLILSFLGFGLAAFFCSHNEKKIHVLLGCPSSAG